MTDDYKAEILSRLNTSSLYQVLKEKCNESDSDVIATIDAGVSYAHQRSKTVMKYMGEYTLHDGDHLFRVLHLMESILGAENVKKLSAPELMLLILSAFFHDLGMAPSEKEVIQWKKAWDKTTFDFEDNVQKESFNDFKRYVASRLDDQERICELLNRGEFVAADTLQGYVISDYIRKSHATRARTIIGGDEILSRKGNNRIVFRRTDLTVELAEICFSHNEDAIGLLKLDKNMIFGNEIYACLPLVGIVLRLADIIDFDAKRTPEVLFSHLNIKHPVSLLEWQKHRAVENWQIRPDEYLFVARCGHPAIEAAIRRFCDSIDAELSVCNNILNSLNENGKFKSRDIAIKIPLRISRDRIEAEKDVYGKPKYIYRDTKFTLSKQQVIDLLMGTKLYGNPEIALRELIQNSLDACLLRQAMEKQWGNSFFPRITVRLYEEAGLQFLEVDDNGTGMDQDIIDNYYTKVGASFYKSPEFNNLLVDTGADMRPTSRFGIGILSVFMVADNLKVDTMRLKGPQKSGDAISLTAEGQDSIFWVREGGRTSVGTTTSLILRKGKNPWDKMSDEKFIEAVESTVPNPPFPIRIQAGNKETIRDSESFMKERSNLSREHTWLENENIKRIQFGFKHAGLTGSCIIGILENGRKPVLELKIKEKTIVIDEEEFPLDKYFEVKDNEITIRSTSIGVDRRGTIKSEKTGYDGVKSESSVSLHGIEIPTELFLDSWKLRRGQVRLAWPFAINLVVDISSPLDLDLNSARNEILNTEKWRSFEEELAFCIACGIKSNISVKYWNFFIKDIILLSGESQLRKGFDRAHELSKNDSVRPQIQKLKLRREDMGDIDNLPF